MTESPVTGIAEKSGISAAPDIGLRPATRADSQAIAALLTAAFPTDAEARLVERLVSDGDAAVSLVALAGGEVVGSVVLSRMDVAADGKQLDALGLAPVAVLPHYQRRGIGSLLIRAAIDEARSLGTDIIFLLGEPEYYARFGFSVDAAKPFRSPYSGPYFQALALRSGDQPPSSGTAEYASAFALLS